jgi:hypothetical protein
VGFEPAISTFEHPQTHALNRAAASFGIEEMLDLIRLFLPHTLHTGR